MSDEAPEAAEVVNEQEDLTSVDIVHGEYQDAAPAETKQKEASATSETDGEKQAEPETDPDKKDEQSAEKKDEHSAEGSEAGEAGDGSTAKPKGAQKRIGKLTYEMREAQRERDYWREQALGAKKATDTSDTTEESNTGNDIEMPVPPTLEGVEFDEAKYSQAMAKWAVDCAEAMDAQKTASQKATQEMESAQEQMITFFEKENTFSESKDDYEDVAKNPDLEINETMRDVLFASDMGPQILYHLGENPSEASRISRLPPMTAALEIGKLEARLTTPIKSKTSSAPAPVKTAVKGASAPAAKDEHRFLSGATFD